jgi:hypothetical protein
VTFELYQTHWQEIWEAVDTFTLRLAPDIWCLQAHRLSVMHMHMATLNHWTAHGATNWLLSGQALSVTFELYPQWIRCNIITSSSSKSPHKILMISIDFSCYISRSAIYCCRDLQVGGGTSVRSQNLYRRIIEFLDYSAVGSCGQNCMIHWVTNL